MIPYILKTDSLTLFPVGAAPLTVHKDHLNFEAVRQAIIDGRFDDAVALGSVKTFVNTTTNGAVSVSDDGVTFNGVPINSYLSNKMIQFFREGLDIQHYCRFLENLMANPSMTSREELFLFLEAADLPITEDGCFLAYKGVTDDFKDIHSRTFDNSPGQILSMPRRDVDDNRDRTCSYGFHAAAYSYARNFMGGGRLIAVKINPADVVSVPSDYNNQKLRTCRYEVMFEVEDADDTLTGRTYYQTHSPAETDEDEAELTDYDEGYMAAQDGANIAPGRSAEYYDGYNAHLNGE